MIDEYRLTPGLKCSHCGVDLLEGVRVHTAAQCRDLLEAEVKRLRPVVERMSKHYGCDAFEGTFAEMRFVGCELFRSDDPEEYCLRCDALAALAVER